MKKVLFLSLLLSLASAGFSQSDRYIDAMKKNISQIDSVALKNNISELANNFQRIAAAEKNQWLPYYYAAYLTVVQVLLKPGGDNQDEVADHAGDLLDAALRILGKENSETYVIRAMIATAHMTVDPQSRYMQYGPEISQSLHRAQALDPSNPRPVLYQAQSLFHTPEFAGGGKEVAKPFFEKAKKLFAEFKPENELSPAWGKIALDYYMKNYE